MRWCNKKIYLEETHLINSLSENRHCKKITMYIRNHCSTKCITFYWKVMYVWALVYTTPYLYSIENENGSIYSFKFKLFLLDSNKSRRSVFIYNNFLPRKVFCRKPKAAIYQHILTFFSCMLLRIVKVEKLKKLSSKLV